LAGWPVTASPHSILNTCKGVVKFAALIDCRREKMLKELEPQGVSDIFNISVKYDSGGSRNTNKYDSGGSRNPNTFVITFRTRVVPKHLTENIFRLARKV